MTVLGWLLYAGVSLGIGITLIPLSYKRVAVFLLLLVMWDLIPTVFKS